MIKNAIKDPLQEEMLVKKFNEECANVEASPYGFGEAAAMIYEAEIEQAWNALMEQVGIAELKYYNEYGILLNFNEADEGDATNNDAAAEDSGKDKGKAAGAIDAAKAAGSAFVKKVQEILEKIKKAIQSVWNAAINKFKQVDLANEAFVKKFEEKLNTIKSKSIKITATTYDMTKINETIKTLKGCEGTIDSIVSRGPHQDTAKADFYKATLNADSFDNFKKSIISSGEIERTVGNALAGLKNSKSATALAQKVQADATAAIDKFSREVNGNVNNLKIELNKLAATLCQSVASLAIDAAKADTVINRKICTEALKQAGEKVVDSAKNAANNAGAAVKNAADKAGDAVKGAVDKVKGGNAEPAAQGESATFNSMSVNSILESINFA